ncbi:MAG: hypothetical protein A2086_00730 [Spirochaetes bacterium GWD1_27_9]|nr:MAG: hypothetical protein A2Z98_06575 [Spirochaetes bacterium GWB1_27_13]OHD25901.1 MAG: hypothetical protein A2Y34_01925 [Spirochaetes bacterium GWC1_27_15]OHD32535.1 MAG: hypothetical protein A2086_00730 [Spirochaetes bacterium GWD1_27_9]
MKKIIIIILSLFLIFLCYSKENRKFPQLKFIVLSDIHYYDKSLGIEGTAFEEYLAGDRKTLIESEEITDKVIENILSSDASFVIICGDMTKDGEKINHQKLSEKLKLITDSGKKVFVINGNHDILNGHSFKYNGDNKERVENVNREDFIKIYNEFGYSSAIEVDPISLSYVTEPVAGVWLLAIDSSMWYKNKLDKEPITDGELRAETLKWIENILIKAKSQNKTLIGMMHHGLLEHYKSNNKYYGQYILNNNEKIAKIFTKYGLNFIFTGHFHAQDITLKKINKDDTIFDIETGSLVSYPNPYRIVSITKNNKMKIESKFISSIKNYPDFSSYSKDFIRNGTIKTVNKKLKRLGLTDNEIDIVSFQIADAYISHLVGDEISPKKLIDTNGVGLWGRILLNFQKDLVEGWYNDLPPHDNFITIDLNSY